MSKVFMTVMGTGDYRITNYSLRRAVDRDRFVQKSLLRILKGEGKTFDRIVVFLTKEAERDSWERYYRQTAKETTEDEGLKPFLMREFPDAEIIPYEIESGMDEEELKSIFKAMYDAMEKDDEITFDITHGFRTLPLLFFPVLQYAKELKKIRVENIYYGMYHASGDNSAIIELGHYNEILDWANAAHDFVCSGSARSLAEMTSKHSGGLEGKERGRVVNPAKSLNNLTKAIMACHGGKGKGGIQDCARNLAKHCDRIPENDNDPLLALLHHAVDKAQPFVEAARGEKTALETAKATIEWCMEHGMLQQAYTALEESIVTFFCELLHGSGAKTWSKKYREDVINSAINAANPSRDPNKDRKKPKTGTDAEDYQRVYDLVRQDDRIIGLSQRIKDYRNQMNHFAMRDRATPVDKMTSQLAQSFEDVFKAFDRLTEAYNRSAH